MREEFYVYSPQQGTQLDSGNIMINIHSKDIHTKPKKSFLLFEGTFTDGAGADVDITKTTLQNNAMMYLFNNLSLRINDMQVESIFNPGQATTMMGMLRYPDDFNKSRGLNLCWYPDTDATIGNIAAEARNAVSKGTFQFAVPLDHIVSFCEDYPETFYGVKFTLLLDRAATINDAVWSSVPAKLKLTKLDWVMPQLSLDTDEQIKFLNNSLEQREKVIDTRVKNLRFLPVPEVSTFTWNLGSINPTEHPEWLVVGFQTGKLGKLSENSAIFDNLDLISCHCLINGDRFPQSNFRYDFNTNKVATLFNNVANFQEAYYGVDELNTNTGIRPTTFKSLYPLLVFDIRKTAPIVSVTDITFNADFATNAPKGTVAYALLLNNRQLKMQYDGSDLGFQFIK